MRSRIFCLFLAFSLLWGQLSLANNYRILYLSSPDAVKVNGKVAKVGTVFADSATLDWLNDRQVIKVAETETEKQYIICARSVPGKSSFTLSDYFFLNKTLASRGGQHESLSELAVLFKGIIEVDGNLSVSTDILQDDTHFFYLTLNLPEGAVNKAIKARKGQLVLSTNELFMIDGAPIAPLAVEAALFYYDAGDETSICVSPLFLLVPVP